MTRVSYDYHLNESIGGAIAAADILFIYQIFEDRIFFARKGSGNRL